MPTLDESTDRGYESLHATLAAALAELGQYQEVTFFRYARYVLPLDGYIFWIKSGEMAVKGVLHYGSQIRQDEANASTVNTITFTTDQEVSQFNAVSPSELFVGFFQPPRNPQSPPPPILRFGFSQRAPVMRQAGLYHYSGHALYSSMSTQLIDRLDQIDPTQLIVSNSLPAWLALSGYNQPWLYAKNPGITLYPSFALPDNLSPPYGAVHIEPSSIRSMQGAPWFDSATSSRYDLTEERVKITLYGCNNSTAHDFLSVVQNYSQDTLGFGIMSMMPAIRDEKETQSEFGILAQKKSMEFEVSYDQVRMNTIARQLVDSALLDVINQLDAPFLPIIVGLLPEFRQIGAFGNNLQTPSLNPIPGTTEIRIAPANFAPGPDSPLITGPNPRTISNVVCSGEHSDDPDPTFSVWLYVFGQFVDHDLDLESVGSTPIDIPIPNGDPDFPDGSSIPLNRAITDPITGTIINTIAGYLDLSQIYGSDTTIAGSLRNDDGTMRTSAGNALPIVNGMFVSGDVRVTENSELTAVSIMFVREHNYWVRQLRHQHPEWTGDQLYNMARAITIAEYQNVIYTEYLPALIGPTAISPYVGYDPTVNSQVTQEFSTAAFRVGHSQISDDQKGIDNNGNVTFTQSLLQSFFNTPTDVLANGIDDALRSFSSEFSQNTDVYVVDGLRNLLFAPPDAIDLIAIDIQRERDVGLGTLNQTRHALGMSTYTTFAQLTSDSEVQENLSTVFDTIDDVDLFIGGLAEDHADGAIVGPTFQAIIADQFKRLRDGDRFFWQNQPFDEATKSMIANTELGDIILRTTATTIDQSHAFIAKQNRPTIGHTTAPVRTEISLLIES